MHHLTLGIINLIPTSQHYTSLHHSCINVHNQPHVDLFTVLTIHTPHVWCSLQTGTPVSLRCQSCCCTCLSHGCPGVATRQVPQRMFHSHTACLEVSGGHADGHHQPLWNTGVIIRVKVQTGSGTGGRWCKWLNGWPATWLPEGTHTHGRTHFTQSPAVDPHVPPSPTTCHTTSPFLTLSLEGDSWGSTEIHTWAIHPAGLW